MRKFIFTLTGVILLTSVCLELVLRTFDLARYTLPTVCFQGNKLYTPGYHGLYVGGGFGEISAPFKFNNQGWNSTLDYSVRDSTKINVALIGNSYVEGFQVDVRKSIGRILDSLFVNQTITHEYGHSGSNIVDFEMVYRNFIRDQYDYVFVLISDGSLVDNSPTYMGVCEDDVKDNWIRDIYTKSALLSYININQYFSENAKKSFSNLFSFNRGPVKPKLKKKLRKCNFDGIIYYLYEPGKLDVNEYCRLNKLDKEFLVPVIHSEDEIINFGFDTHWNSNGRLNCAEAMYFSIQNNLKLRN